MKVSGFAGQFEFFRQQEDILLFLSFYPCFFRWLTTKITKGLWPSIHGLCLHQPPVTVPLPEDRLLDLAGGVTGYVVEDNLPGALVAGKLPAEGDRKSVV